MQSSVFLLAKCPFVKAIPYYNLQMISLFDEIIQFAIPTNKVFLNTSHSQHNLHSKFFFYNLFLVNDILLFRRILLLV